MKKIISSCLILLGIILPTSAQIYTPSGTIHGSSGNNNVGIGILSPTQTLDVNGNGLFRGSIITSIPGNIGGTISLINELKSSNGTGQRWSIYNMTGDYGNSLQFWAYDNLGCVKGGMCVNRFTIMDNGNVGIGTTSPDSKLTVKGKIHAEEIKIDMAIPADYVFEKYYTGKSELKPDYNLPTLSEVEKFTKENHHLPMVPSANEIKENGLLLGEMSNILLQKIEELTLYSIEQQKTIQKLQKENESFKILEERLVKLEKELATKR